VARTLIKNQDKPVPPEAEAEFPGLAERLALVDDGFDAIPADDDHYDDYECADREARDYDPEFEETILPFDPATMADHDDPGEDDFFDESEDLEEEEADANNFFDEPVEEEDDEQTARYKAMLTPEVMEKMLANMRANGIIV
jgi:hypothetical protein